MSAALPRVEDGGDDESMSDNGTVAQAATFDIAVLGSKPQPSGAHRQPPLPRDDFEFRKAIRRCIIVVQAYLFSPNTCCTSTRLVISTFTQMTVRRYCRSA